MEKDKTVRVAIIGASYLQLPLILKAKELHYETHVFAWECNDVGEKCADYFYPISITEKERILEKCIDIKIDGIISIASDLAMLTVNYVAGNMNLTCNTMDCTIKSTNKSIMRKSFLECQDPSPWSKKYTSFDDVNIEELEFPVVVKPCDRSGSRGITMLESSQDLKEAFFKAMNESFQKEILIEEFIKGDEYSIECISFEGQHTCLAITKKHTTGAPNFIETGHEEPSGLGEEKCEEIIEIVFHALDSLGIQYGASHSEVIITPNNNVKIIEIGGRMGGDCIGSHLVYYSTGYDYVKMVLQISLGKSPEFIKDFEGKPVAVKYIFNQDDLNSLEKLKQEHNDSIIYISKIDISSSKKITDSSNRLGCYVYYL